MTNIAKTINMYIIAEMYRESPDASFDYLSPIISEDGKQIYVLPKDARCAFIDSYLSDSFVEVDNIEDNLRIFGLNLSVNIEMIDTENDNFYIEPCDELGELVIKLDANLESEAGSAKFIDPIAVNTKVDLVEEVEAEVDNKDEEAENATENTSEESPVENDPELDNSNDSDKPDTSSIHADVLIEADLSDEEGPEWIITYDLKSTNESLTEDEETESDNVDVITAPDIESAAKYAEQNARIKARENPSWNSAEVISIEKKVSAE